jgi:hypothetical protein
LNELLRSTAVMVRSRLWRSARDFRLFRSSPVVIVLCILFDRFLTIECGFSRSSNSSGSVISGWNSEQCSQSSDRCSALGQTQCLDLVLPYRAALPGGVWNVSGHPSVPWINSAASSMTGSSLFSSPDQADVLSYVNLWSGLRSVPRCWAALQTLMCTSLMPRCEAGRVQTPSVDLCRTVRTQCKVIDVYMKYDPRSKSVLIHFRDVNPFVLLLS